MYTYSFHPSHKCSPHTYSMTRHYAGQWGFQHEEGTVPVPPPWAEEGSTRSGAHRRKWGALPCSSRSCSCSLIPSSNVRRGPPASGWGAPSSPLLSLTHTKHTKENTPITDMNNTLHRSMLLSILWILEICLSLSAGLLQYLP